MKIYVEMLNGQVYEIPNIDQHGSSNDFLMMFREERLNKGNFLNVAGFNSKAVLRYWVDGNPPTEIINISPMEVIKEASQDLEV